MPSNANLRTTNFYVWKLFLGVFPLFSEFKTAIFFQTVDFYAKLCYILKASQKNNKSTLEISDYV